MWKKNKLSQFYTLRRGEIDFIKTKGRHSPCCHLKAGQLSLIAVETKACVLPTDFISFTCLSHLCRLISSSSILICMSRSNSFACLSWTLAILVLDRFNAASLPLMSATRRSSHLVDPSSCSPTSAGRARKVSPKGGGAGSCCWSCWCCASAAAAAAPAAIAVAAICGNRVAMLPAAPGGAWNPAAAAPGTPRCAPPAHTAFGMSRPRWWCCCWA
mmetsp:Transcript_9323/g.32289  ORF Transcript_9323/g.32289 Transcript_9323/m.32289 type:complete len:215 (+) Transcript_9323:2078-2722(+)